MNCTSIASSSIQEPTCPLMDIAYQIRRGFVECATKRANDVAHLTSAHRDRGNGGRQLLEGVAPLRPTLPLQYEYVVLLDPAVVPPGDVQMSIDHVEDEGPLKLKAC